MIGTVYEAALGGQRCWVRGADYQTPYSGWAGYTFMIVKSFNLANMKAWLLGGTYDFATQGVPGLLLNANLANTYFTLGHLVEGRAIALDLVDRLTAQKPAARAPRAPRGSARAASAPPKTP